VYTKSNEISCVVCIHHSEGALVNFGKASARVWKCSYIWHKVVNLILKQKSERELNSLHCAPAATDILKELMTNEGTVGWPTRSGAEGAKGLLRKGVLHSWCTLSRIWKRRCFLRRGIVVSILFQERIPQTLTVITVKTVLRELLLVSVWRACMFSVICNVLSRQSSFHFTW
jgi:hypothetical protein